jgi:hypothetical protein
VPWPPAGYPEGGWRLPFLERDEATTLRGRMQIDEWRR